eukprot:TRINITY_DN1708_c0_g1_i1.p1 TRINITY_DN1708_c0_g1~~TRINITY_DN1708_c0_g1_i1.p1  ORF type:complete len:435 (-),score=103.08 TRINITY_DN1708_c0_g1_i1:87-1322(-)
MDPKVSYQPLSQSPETSSQPDLEDQVPSPKAQPTNPPTSVQPPPSYESISQSKVEQTPRRKCRRNGKCANFCVGCCSCYGIFCFTWSLLIIFSLCLTTVYYASVVDHCINPPVTYETVEYISFQEKHPNLKDLNIFISVVSGSIRLETTESEDLIVKVIQGAGDQETVEENTSYNVHYNSTHLSLIGETPSTLFDCPTVQIIVQIPYFSESSPNKWTLKVETGHVHIKEFIGTESEMQIHLTTGAVQIDTLVVKHLEVVTNAGAIYWAYGSSDVSGHAKLLTNSGYVKVEGVDSSGSFHFGTNTGVVNLRQIKTVGKIEVKGGWGILRLSDVKSDNGVYINSDSAFVSFQNDWASSSLSFSTEDGSLDLEHLTTEFIESTNTEMTIYFPGGSEPALYYISTVSGVVTLYEL